MASTSRTAILDSDAIQLPHLAEEEAHGLEPRARAEQAHRAAAGLARYKLELFFAHTRSVIRPCAGAISVWESGTALAGGGDAKVYLCPGRTRGRSDCEAIIPDRANGYGFLVCPACREVWRADEVDGEVFANLALPRWADLLVRMFHRLGASADIVLKHPREDLRVASAKEQARQRMGEHLARARAARVTVVYPLARILADTQCGADLGARFLAFLRA